MRRERQLGIVNRLLNQLHVLGIEWLDDNLCRLGDGYRSHGADLGRRAVVLDADMLDHRRRRPARPHPAQLLLEMLDGFLHVLFAIQKDVINGHGGSPSSARWQYRRPDLLTLYHS